MKDMITAEDMIKRLGLEKKRNNMIDKDKAKAVAKKEVARRVVTIQEAKDNFRQWINETSCVGGFSKEVLDFWDEVSKQVDEL